MMESAIFRFRRILTFTIVILICVAGVLGYTRLMAKTGSGTPPALRSPDQQADHILVSKSDRMMYLLREGEILRSYKIVMGANWADGHKEREGDKRTPEGTYVIDWRNPRSVAHLSLHISYPNDDDKRRAAEGGYAPGGNIMIHGLPNGWGALGPLHRAFNWTDGCIAVTNQEMQEIWSLTPVNTPITVAGTATP